MHETIPSFELSRTPKESRPARSFRRVRGANDVVATSPCTPIEG
jgi:hypothetical protein